jgi:hypothetical protein
MATNRALIVIWNGKGVLEPERNGESATVAEAEGGYRERW